MADERTILRRYTNLPSLITILTNKALTLGTTDHWEDKNDRCTIELYKKIKNLKELFALCLTEADETYHHWKVYSGGQDGICIEFYKEQLIQEINKNDEIIHRPVDYKKIDEIKSIKNITEDLPFIKRYPFIDEREYRIIYEPKQKDDRAKIELRPEMIRKIKTSPWLRFGHKEIESIIKGIDGWNETEINKSKLIDYERWINYFQ